MSKRTYLLGLLPYISVCTFAKIYVPETEWEIIHYIKVFHALFTSTICAMYLLHLLLSRFVLTLAKLRNPESKSTRNSTGDEVEEEFDDALPTWLSELKTLTTFIIAAGVCAWLILPAEEIICRACDSSFHLDLLDRVIGTSRVLLPAAATTASLLIIFWWVLSAIYHIVRASHPYPHPHPHLTLYQGEMPWTLSHPPTPFQHVCFFIINAYAVGLAIALSSLPSPFERSVMPVWTLNYMACVVLRGIAGMCIIAHVWMYVVIVREAKCPRAIDDLECGGAGYVDGEEINIGEIVFKENEDELEEKIEV